MKYRNSKYIRDTFGISQVTVWRWIKSGTLPQPTVIRRRNYWLDSQLVECIDLMKN